MSEQTLSAMFDKYSDAADAVTRLEAMGVQHDHISIVSNDADHQKYYGDASDDNNTGTGASLGTLIGGGAGLLTGLGLMAIPGVGPVVAAGWLVSTLVGAGIGAATGGLVGSLTHAGVDEADAHVYAEGVRRGGTLVTVRADSSMSEKIVDVLDDHGTIDLDEREATWRKDGWTGAPASTAPSAAGVAGAIGGAAASVASGVGNVARDVKDSVMGEAAPRTDRSYAAASPATMDTRSATSSVGDDETIKVMEENLQVGKREENRGRVRIHSRVVETPVQEQVNLRSERVTIERRPVDRAMTGVNEDAFHDRTIEAVEHTEVPVVSKEMRVKEEIGIRKDVENRTETVSDKVRHTEVEVEDERTASGQAVQPNPTRTAR